MELHLRLEGRRDLARQVYRQLRTAIATGRLVRGDRLPPTRELARRLEIARNTVALAYEWLAAEGLLAGRRGGGTFVQSDPAPRHRRRAGASMRPRAVWSSIAAPGARLPAPAFDFGVGIPDSTLFPFDTWRRLLARQLRASRLTADYGDPAGHPKLRASIARYLAVSRGVDATAEDVLVTHGAQQAFDLVARVLLEPGARVAVEEPGYAPARHLFESYGARVSPVRVDAEGLLVHALPDDARLVYVTPSHQFPLGMPMSAARRAALLAWADRRDAVVVEDDYDSEFRFGGRPLETLQASDRRGRVVYVGSFSKSLLPSLRLGFVIAPPALREALRAAAYVAGWFGQGPAQAALATLIDEGLLARHVRRMRREYAARHELILGGLTSRFGDWLEPVPSVAGMHLAAKLVAGGLRFEHEVWLAAQRAGVRFDRLSASCATQPALAGVVLGYGAIATPAVEEGLRRLRASFAAASRRKRA